MTFHLLSLRVPIESGRGNLKHYLSYICYALNRYTSMLSEARDDTEGYHKKTVQTG